MADQLQTVHALLVPLLEDRGLHLYDVELHGASLVVAVDGPSGVDLDTLGEATAAISRALDDADPIAGRYTLEVTSPGLERRLRTPEHFAAAVGETVSVRTLPGTPGARRVTGRLTVAGAEGIELADVAETDGPLHVAYGDIERARTVFAWGASPAPSPSRGKPGGRSHAKTERVTTR
jgi:ribosome maturation factor RimP